MFSSGLGFYWFRWKNFLFVLNALRQKCCGIVKSDWISHTFLKEEVRICSCTCGCCLMWPQRWRGASKRVLRLVRALGLLPVDSSKSFLSLESVFENHLYSYSSYSGHCCCGATCSQRNRCQAHVKLMKIYLLPVVSSSRRKCLAHNFLPHCSLEIQEFWCG